jgi:hypothetical protein
MWRFLAVAAVAGLVLGGCENKVPTGPGLVETRTATPPTAPTSSAPTVTIVTPTDAANVAQGAMVTFSARATDPEDGDVSSTITWTSNLQGSLGSGASVTKALTILGAHTITARATDTTAHTGTAAVVVTVGNPEAPRVAISAPIPDTTVTLGTKLTFVATATDLDNRNISANVEWSSSLDGDFGTGAQITYAPTNVGTHFITASVRDSRGLTGAAVVSVTIAAQPPVLFANLIFRNAPGTGAPNAPNFMSLTLSLLSGALPSGTASAPVATANAPAPALAAPRYSVSGFFTTPAGGRGTISGELLGTPTAGQLTLTLTVTTAGSCSPQADFVGTLAEQSLQLRRAVTTQACGGTFPFDDFVGVPATGPVPPPPPTPTTCTFSVRDPSTVPAQPESPIEIIISGQTGCAWSAQTLTSWLTVLAPFGGTLDASGTATVDVTVQPNTGAARDGTLRIAGKTVTIHQNGAPTTFVLSVGGTTKPWCNTPSSILSTPPLDYPQITAPGSFTYTNRVLPSGTVVQLSASEATISAWSGCDSSVAGTCTVTMNADRSPRATIQESCPTPSFDTVRPPVQVTRNDEVMWEIAFSVTNLVPFGPTTGVLNDKVEASCTGFTTSVTFPTSISGTHSGIIFVPVSSCPCGGSLTLQDFNGTASAGWTPVDRCGETLHSKN